MIASALFISLECFYKINLLVKDIYVTTYYQIFYKGAFKSLKKVLVCAGVSEDALKVLIRV